MADVSSVGPRDSWERPDHELISSPFPRAGQRRTLCGHLGWPRNSAWSASARNCLRHAQSAGVAKESVEKYDQENYNKWNLIVDSLRISSHFSPITASISVWPTLNQRFLHRRQVPESDPGDSDQAGEPPGVILLGRGSQMIFKDRKDALPHSPCSTRFQCGSPLLQKCSKSQRKRPQERGELDKSRAGYLRNFYSTDVIDAQFYHLILTPASSTRPNLPDHQPCR